MLQSIRDALAENGATAPDALGKAVKAFGDGYTLETIDSWLAVQRVDDPIQSDVVKCPIER
jgi:hypothetical protein